MEGTVKRVKLSEITTFEELILWINDHFDKNLVEDPNFISKDIFSEIIKKLLDNSKTNISNILSIWNANKSFRKWSKNIWKMIFQKILAKNGTNTMVEKYQNIFNMNEIINSWPTELENQFLVFYIFYHFYLNQNQSGIYRKLYFGDYITFFRINLRSKKIEIGQQKWDEKHDFFFNYVKPSQIQNDHLRKLDLKSEKKLDEDGLTGYYIQIDDKTQFIPIIYKLIMLGWNFRWKLNTNMEINCQVCQTKALYICCPDTHYCGEKCQATDWKDNHEYICKRNQAKFHKVMKEFKEGKLHSGKSGKIVTDKKQAWAIAYSESSN
jgi:hypothetical protein